MSFPTITGAGQTHTLANGVTYVVTPNLAWRIQSFPTNISLLSEFTLPGSGFVGDLVPRPRLYIDDTANPDVLMTLDSATNTYTPGGGLLKSQLDALNATAAGATYPTATGIPASYVDDTVNPAVLKLWDGSGYVDAGGGATDLGGNVTPAAVTIQNGTAFSETFTSSSGVAPFTWSLSSGSLPAGLTLNSSTGAITGTPTDAGGTAYNFTLRATDSNGDYNDGVYSGSVLGSDLAGTITPASPPFSEGVPVSETFASSNGTAPFTWSIVAGALPTGLTLNSVSGVLSGTPTDADGTAYTFTVRATDANGDYNDEIYTGNLGSDLAGSVTPASITVESGGVFSETLASSNGTAPFTWYVYSGTLPSGLSLNTSTGAITGTPTDPAGTAYNFTIRGQDANGDYNDITYSGSSVGSVLGGGSITPTSVTITEGAALSQTLVAAGGTSPYTWSIVAGTLPTGLTLNSSTGVLSGTPTDTAGTAYSFTVRMTDANLDYFDQAYTGNVAAASDGPVNPLSLTGAVATLSTARNVSDKAYDVQKVGDNHIYYLSGAQRIVVMDYSTPTAPVEVINNYSPNGSGSILTISANPSGTRLLVGQFGVDVPELVDVSNPAAPSQIVTDLSGPVVRPQGYELSVMTWISDDVCVFVRDNDASKLKIVDFSNPAATITQTITTPQPHNGFGAVYDPATQHFFVRDATTGHMMVYDATVPTAVTYVATVDVFGGSASLNIAEYEICDNSLFVFTDSANQFFLVDVSNPAAPVRVFEDTATSDTLLRGQAADGGYLYRNNYFNDADLTVWDISAPASASLVNTVPTLTADGCSNGECEMHPIFINGAVVFINNLDSLTWT